MKKNIALVTGGYSSESVISYKSADSILQHIDNEKWNCYLIDIRLDGWFYINASGQTTTVDKNDFSIIEQDQKIIFDAVLIGLHGTPGEDENCKVILIVWVYHILLAMPLVQH